VVTGDEFSIALARVLADGTLDASFGAGGTVTTAVGHDSGGAALALAPDGGILVAGEARIGGREAIVLLRYRSDGELDPSFGTRGKTIVRFAGDASTWAMALQPDGRIVVGGYAPEGLIWIPGPAATFLPRRRPRRFARRSSIREAGSRPRKQRSSPMSPAKKTVATVIPTLRYKDAPAAIDWLCRAFGFERHLVVPGDGHTIAHAQLTFGNGMIMLGSARADEFGRLQKTPAEVGGVGTGSPYVVVDDPDAHHAKAVAAGAKVVIELKTEDYGGRGYSCLDPEGHLWSFGSFDPWAEA